MLCVSKSKLGKFWRSKFGTKRIQSWTNLVKFGQTFDGKFRGKSLNVLFSKLKRRTVTGFVYQDSFTAELSGSTPPSGFPGIPDKGWNSCEDSGGQPVNRTLWTRVLSNLPEVGWKSNMNKLAKLRSDWGFRSATMFSFQKVLKTLQRPSKFASKSL